MGRPLFVMGSIILEYITLESDDCKSSQSKNDSERYTFNVHIQLFTAIEKVKLILFDVKIKKVTGIFERIEL